MASRYELQINLENEWELSLLFVFLLFLLHLLNHIQLGEASKNPNFSLLEPPLSPKFYTSLAINPSWKNLQHATFLMAYYPWLSNQEDLGVGNTHGYMNQLDNSHIWIWWCLCICPGILDRGITSLGWWGCYYSTAIHYYPVGICPQGYLSSFPEKLKLRSLMWDVRIFQGWLIF